MPRGVPGGVGDPPRVAGTAETERASVEDVSPVGPGSTADGLTSTGRLIDVPLPGCHSPARGSTDATSPGAQRPSPKSQSSRVRLSPARAASTTRGGPDLPQFRPEPRPPEPPRHPRNPQPGSRPPSRPSVTGSGFANVSGRSGPVIKGLL